jgi:hypothetical protein
MRVLSGWCVLVCLTLGWLAGCNGLDDADTPRITVTPGTLAFGQVPVGSRQIEVVTVRNEGLGQLLVSEIRLESQSGFLELSGADSLTLPPGGSEVVGVVYAPLTPRDSAGTLIFFSNDPSQPVLRVPITTTLLVPQPNIVRRRGDISGDLLDFGLVAEASRNVRFRGIENIGGAPLIVCEAFATGSADFSTDLPQALEAARGDAPFAVVQALGSEAGGLTTVDFELVYAPPSPGPDAGELVVIYDGTGFVDGACAEDRRVEVRFPLAGEAGSPFLRVEPNPLNFGETPIGVTRERLLTLSNGGELPLEIFSVRLDRNRTPVEFDLPAVGGLPATLPPSESLAVEVSYLPSTEVASAGVVQIEHSDGLGGRTTTEVLIAGVGVPDRCPVSVARAFIQEDAQNRVGDEVDWALPLQTLVLDGTRSTDPNGGPIAEYLWEIVEQPPGAINGLRPFVGAPANEALRQYFLPLSGAYLFRLTVLSTSGFESCEPALVRVLVVPQQAISIELTWDNPLDPDQNDNEGSDLDLHFLKMINPWFARPWDVYFANPAPAWNPETPSLDRDDTDGAGPETIQMDDPQPDQCYAIGVHYFRQMFGTAYPTVRIYIDGTLRAEFSGALDRTDDFWDVARVHWPSRTIYQVDEYVQGIDSTSAPIPAVTEAMIRNGHCNR